MLCSFVKADGADCQTFWPTEDNQPRQVQFMKSLQQNWFEGYIASCWLMSNSSKKYLTATSVVLPTPLHNDALDLSLIAPLARNKIGMVTRRCSRQPISGEHYGQNRCK